MEWNRIEYKNGEHSSDPCILTIMFFAAVMFMHLAVLHFEQSAASC